MANPNEPGNDNPLDVARIRQLARIMRDHELSELSFQQGEIRLRLRRGAVGGPVVASPAFAVAGLTTPSSAPVMAEQAAAPAHAPAAATASTTINSPIVGTFYTAPSPDVAPFVTVGSTVSAETIVCIIEAMKVFNEIPAGLSGTIKEVLVENGAPVEYGQPLFRVE